MIIWDHIQMPNIFQYSIIRPSITNQKTWTNFKWTGILTNSRSFQENNISFNLYNALGTIYNQPITIMH